MRFSKNIHLKTNTGICTGRARHEQTHHHKSHLFPLLSSHKSSKSSADLSIFISHYDKTLFSPNSDRVSVCVGVRWSGMVIDGCVCVPNLCWGSRACATTLNEKDFCSKFLFIFLSQKFFRNFSAAVRKVWGKLPACPARRAAEVRRGTLTKINVLS